MRTARAMAEGHPQLADALLAAALAAVSLPFLPAERMSSFDWLWFVLLHVPLVWRRLVPLWSYGAVWLLWFAAAAADGSGLFLLFVPVVALYTVARYRRRRDLVVSAGAVAVPLAIGWLLAGGEWWDLLFLGAIGAAAALLGVTVQTRRAYLAELEDRAKRLERDRDQQAQLAVAAERSRIAREMHDIVAHNLAVMVALADGAVATTSTAPDRATDMMQKVSTTGREALGEIRRLVDLLRSKDAADESPDPSPQPGLDDVDDLVEQVRAAGVEVALTREGVPGAWGPGAGLAVYRIVQEALTNTMKHAGPHARAEVRLRYTSGGAELDVVDDGAQRRSVPVTVPPPSGNGLTGMCERAAAYRGAVEAGPRPGTGWRVHARLCFEDGEIA